MIGKAFNLDEAAFPRIISPQLASLEKSLGALLGTLYKHVETPIAAPWKSDFASVYFVVSGPRSDNAREAIKSVIGASLDKTGGTDAATLLFAIPSSTKGKYTKVEVHECQTKAELDCTKFYLSYGDLGSILSLLARIHGFTLGTKGLKTHYEKPTDEKISGFVLTNSPDKIVRFFGLVFDTWARGFKSQDDVFAWVRTSRFFNTAQILASDKKSKKSASDIQVRQMYYSFIAYAAAHNAASKSAGAVPNFDAVRKDALLFFECKPDYDGRVRKNLLDRARREKFNGNKVMSWTNLKGKIIHEIMEMVRERIGADGILSMDEKGLKDEVLAAKEKVPVRVDQGKKA